MIYNRKEVPANFVPAAAVIRRGQALSGIIGRKGFVDDYLLFKLKIEIKFQNGLL